MPCFYRDRKLLAYIKVSFLTLNQKQKFAVVTLEPVTLVFRQKADACHGFLLVADLLYTLRNQQGTGMERVWHPYLIHGVVLEVVRSFPSDFYPSRKVDV